MHEAWRDFLVIMAVTTVPTVAETMMKALVTTAFSSDTQEGHISYYHSPLTPNKNWFLDLGSWKLGRGHLPTSRHSFSVITTITFHTLHHEAKKGERNKI